MEPIPLDLTLETDFDVLFERETGELSIHLKAQTKRNPGARGLFLV